MRKFLSFLLVILSIGSALGQGKDIKKAISAGRKPGHFYACNPSDSSPCSLSELWQYAKANDLLINSAIESNVIRFGVPTPSVVYLEFMPKSEKAVFDNEKGHVDDYTALFTTFEELCFASKVDQLRREEKQHAWHTVQVDHLEKSNIERIMDAKRYIHYDAWEGYSKYTICFVHISEMGAPILDDCAKGLSIRQFRNKIEVPVFDGRDMRSETMRWDGTVNAEGRPHGLGHALKLGDSNKALFATVNFVNGLPNGKISYIELDLHLLVGNLANLTRAQYRNMWHADVVIADDLFKRGNTYFDRDYHYAFSLAEEERTDGVFRNGLLEITKTIGKKDVVYSYNKKGKIVNYNNATVNLFKNEINNYKEIVGKTSMSLVSAEKFGPGLRKTVEGACNNKGYNPNKDLLSYIFSTEEARDVVGVESVYYCQAVRELQDVFDRIDKADANYQYESQMDYAYNGNVTYEEESFFFFRSTKANTYSDLGKSFYDYSPKYLKDSYNRIDKLSTFPVSNWNSFKTRSLNYIAQQEPKYSSSIGDKAEKIYNNRLKSYIENDRQRKRERNIKEAERDFKGYRVDGKKSTFPKVK